jgi:hypothetical protein
MDFLVLYCLYHAGPKVHVPLMTILPHLGLCISLGT